MKDFTTSNYINPVIEEIENSYFIDIDNLRNNYLNCSLILVKNIDLCETGHPIIRVSKKDDFYISGLKTLYKILDELSEYTNIVETYPDELFYWKTKEIERIYNKIRDVLIYKHRRENND